NGTEPTYNDEMIRIPIIWSYLGKMKTKNEYIDHINDMILDQTYGDIITYKSYDSVPDDTRGLYQQEFLNSIMPNGLPPYELCLKVGTPILCLRNLDPANGLCNGTRLICQAFYPNIIKAIIAT
ncbi:1305_t:CDS:2, partial [Racocetra persica]